ncbi:lipopolysaccharide core heptose(II) kinase RfaY [Moellerella wisconsensis]|uniref:Lipopolysaccharide core biosynthesis protein n=3 Tax=Moellerella wisconsensis TaxID=158849 RepID=A0ACD3Y6X1_9GAMM|nr:lipopolysaccharide core heptose(II) kinase RfaY [Moellerella wisconsensis]UNH24175.1 lipopolysaccharide core biosynthesis protein [Moellerella wisconsensis]UNH27258.1 lipopolysaccharide core biosynthesis protein [Moellerella wisconsensis]UNH30733.1 lipopolysaccharide core biosynthesis protein [Moellerella wisconsensis]UNH38892.1 lipopolysaccharide core biosynthesis protein [Moellerella wisconsensis]UNH42413.1 lipopolysaccharide core biosynthesis protein [Moellerella wisconsensis]
MTVDIIKIRLKGFTVYQKKSGTDYLKIVRDYKHGQIIGQPLNSGNPQRSVAKIVVDGITYVIKCEKERDTRLEKRISRFFSGPYYSQLLYRVTRAQHLGCDITNDIYLVAEKVKYREALETWILAEYVEGTTLSELKHINQYYDEIKGVINKLHSYDLASNDIHAANFILTENGIKIIDLSDSGNLALCQANDAIALQRFYGINLELNSWAFQLVKLRNRMRQFLRQTKRKKISS